MTPARPPAIDPARPLPPLSGGDDRGWLVVPATGSAAAGTTERLEIEPGLAVVRSTLLAGRQLVESHANPPEQATIVLTFGLEGQSGYVSARGDHLGFRAGYTTAAAFRGSAGERHFEAGRRVVQLRLVIEAPVVARWLDPSTCAGLLPVNGVRPLANVRTSAASESHALALYRCGDATGLDALDCRIHALSLLAGQLRALGLAAAGSNSAVGARDRDRLARARDLMQAQLDRPLTIGYLATSVGMSETRFKAGFRDAFGTSPGQMLLRLRMERARVLLDAGCQVAQAGWQVGYAHPGNFSAAFSRYYGHPPKRLRASRGRG